MSGQRYTPEFKNVIVCNPQARNRQYMSFTPVPTRAFPECLHE